MPRHNQEGPATIEQPMLFGRREEMELLRSRFDDAVAGRGGLVLMAGDAGIGKTSLARVFALEAARSGALVLSGGCYEGEALPFTPFAEALRPYLRSREGGALRAELGAGAAELGEALPEIRLRLPDLKPPRRLEGSSGQLRLFTSFGAFLRAVASEPLLLVLDDLHWADDSSLQLLHFVARDVSSERILVLGCYREAEAISGSALGGLVASLRRQPAVLQIHLKGLNAEATGEIITELTGNASRDLAESIHRGTDGNPFFIVQMAAQFEEDGQAATGGRSMSFGDSAAALPAGIRATLSQQLARLSSETRTLAERLSALSGSFDWKMMAALGDADGDALRRIVRECLERRVLVERGAGAGGYEFAHSLLREVLYRDLDESQRTVLHQRIAGILEHALLTDGEGALLPELAHHARLGAATPELRAAAMAYSERAAHWCESRLAYAEAAHHYELALADTARGGRIEARARAELRLKAAECRRKAGQGQLAAEGFREAAALARQSGEIDLLARAALGFGGEAGVPLDSGRNDWPEVGLIEEALVRLDESDSSLRVRLMARLAMTLTWSPADRERRDELSLQAVDMARRLGDAAALAYALNGRHFATWSPDNANERLAMSDEVIELSRRAGQSASLLEGHRWRFTNLVELGEAAAADRELRTYSELASEVRDPFELVEAQAARAMKLLLSGRFAEAEEAITDNLEAATRIDAPDAELTHGVQMYTLRQEQGRGHELEPAVRGFANAYPDLPNWRIALAAVLAESGRLKEARAEFEHLARRDFRDLTRDLTWLNSFAGLANVCFELDDVERAASLYEMMLPFMGGTVTIGYIRCSGAIDQQLGLLATLLERWDEAADHFARAIDLNTRMGAWPSLARTRLGLARMLKRQGGGVGWDRIEQLLHGALRAAQELGMIRLESRVRDILDEASTADYPHALTAREIEILRLIAGGNSNAQIAESLVLSVRTVEKHVANLYAKIGVRNRAEAATYASRLG